jgi:hypothetical protein
MERHSEVGYAFCPGVRVQNGRELGIVDYSAHGDHDQIVKGHAFLKKLLSYNGVVAASAMGRRHCYEKAGMFPLDSGMSWSGDWYLWCLFALHFEVAYFAEPMVCYRDHNLSMTWALTGEKGLHTCLVGDLAVRLMIRQRTKELGLRGLGRDCDKALAGEYARQFARKQYRSLDRVSLSGMSMDDLEESLSRNISDLKDRNCIRSRVLTEIGDIAYTRGDKVSARKFYLSGARINPRTLKTCLKLILLSLGRSGVYLRSLVSGIRSAPAKIAGADS